MTKTEIKGRIAAFEKTVVTQANQEIIDTGNKAWEAIKANSEVQSVRSFLTQKSAGIDYLNRNLAKKLSSDGRVVKFAGLFLHGTPMVKGWTQNARTGKKKHNGTCELADLMTVFLYLDSGNTIKRRRCVLFQAKMRASPGKNVVGDEVQRRLYDECGGFDYVHGTVAGKGESRRLPSEPARKKALQYLFVEPRPVETRLIPSSNVAAKPVNYGDHLLRFLSAKTGLYQTGKKDDWNQTVTELMENVATEFRTDKKIRGPGIKDVLKAFNSFESHDTWFLDDGEADAGFGLQLIIVWDGQIPADSTTKIIPPGTMGTQMSEVARKKPLPVLVNNETDTEAEVDAGVESEAVELEG